MKRTLEAKKMNYISLLICILIFTGCDKYTNTYIQNKTDNVLLLQFYERTSEIEFNTLRIESNKPGTGNTRYAQVIYIPDKDRRLHIDYLNHVICGSVKENWDETFKGDESSISVEDFAKAYKYCATVRSVNDSLSLVTYQLPKGEKYLIGGGLNTGPVSYYDNLEIIWPDSYDATSCIKFSFYGSQSFENMTVDKDGDYYIVIGKD